MRGLSVLACLLGSASTAQAQQTQTYSYDVHGRLITVARTTGSSSQTTTYSLDSADNRTGRTTSVAPGG
jgi:YD repeat-containing protein